MTIFVYIGSRKKTQQRLALKLTQLQSFRSAGLSITHPRELQRDQQMRSKRRSMHLEGLFQSLWVHRIRTSHVKAPQEEILHRIVEVPLRMAKEGFKVRSKLW